MKHVISILLLCTLIVSCKKATTISATALETPIALAPTQISYFVFAANWSDAMIVDNVQLFVALDSNFSQPVDEYNPNVQGYQYTNIPVGSFYNSLAPGDSGIRRRLATNTKYYYKVRVEKGGMESAFSNIQSVLTSSYDGQISYGSSNGKTVSDLSNDGTMNFITMQIFTGVTYMQSFFRLSNYSSGNTFVSDGANGVVDKSTITGYLNVNGVKYYTKAGGSLTSISGNRFSFSCPVYKSGDALKITNYVVTGTTTY